MNDFLTLDVILSVIDLIIDVVALFCIAYTLLMLVRHTKRMKRYDESLEVFESEREWIREQIVEIVEHIEARGV